jgi:hypothetical protein
MPMLRTSPVSDTTRPPNRTSALPHGLRGLLAISFLTAGRGTVTGYLVGMGVLGAWIACLVTDAPRLLTVLTALVLLPAGTLIVPVVGVLQGQRLPEDYRQLGVRSHLRLWLLHHRWLRDWPLPAGALTDPVIKRHARLIVARAREIAPLARGARAALVGELRSALRDMDDDAATLAVAETVARVVRWESSAHGLPPVGAKLYLRHAPLGHRAAQARRAAARLGVPSDILNYFWHGQVLLLPPARSHRTLASLIDSLLAAGVVNDGRPLPLQITVQGALGDDAKLIALLQMLASGLDLAVEGPERRGDEGNVIARGQRRPELVADVVDHERTDFLFSLVWTPVPDMAAAGYGDQHHRDLRAVQTLAAALRAARRSGSTPSAESHRRAAIWQELARGLGRLCSAWGIDAALTQRYLDVPFADVRPHLEVMLARKAAEPDLATGARRIRDRALALIEFQLAVNQLRAVSRSRRVRLGWMGGSDDQVYRLRGGLRRVRRAIRDGGRVAVMSQRGNTIHVLIDRLTGEGRDVDETHTST